MTNQNALKLFENKKVRTTWDSEQEKWYLSIIDVVEVLTDSPNPRKYWSVLKTRLKKEGSQLATNCSQLKMQSVESFTKPAWQMNWRKIIIPVLIILNSVQLKIIGIFLGRRLHVNYYKYDFYTE